MTRTKNKKRPVRLQPKVVALGDLVKDPDNVRGHPEDNLEAIMASLRDYGQVEPLVTQLGTNRLIAGHGRLEAMERLGWTECEVVFLDVDDDQATELGIILNRTPELAVWKPGVLNQVVDRMKARNPNFRPEKLGFTVDQLERLRSKAQQSNQSGETFTAGMGTSAGAKVEGTRMVQLFVPAESFDEFQAGLARLRERYSTPDNALALLKLMKDTANS